MERSTICNGKLTISMAIVNSKLLVITRGYSTRMLSRSSRKTFNHFTQRRSASCATRAGVLHIFILGVNATSTPRQCCGPCRFMWFSCTGLRDSTLDPHRYIIIWCVCVCMCIYTYIDIVQVIHENTIWPWDSTQMTFNRLDSWKTQEPIHLPLIQWEVLQMFPSTILNHFGKRA